MKRKIEVFTAGCAVCEEPLERVREASCPSCDVTEVSTTSADGLARARSLGVARLPAVAIDGRLADCCRGGPPDLDLLRQLGLGSNDR